MTSAAPEAVSGSGTDRLTVAAAVLGITGFGLSLGFMYPLLSFVLAREAVGISDIGWNAAMMGLGVLASTLALPALTRRVPPRAVVAGSFVAAALIIIAFGWSRDLWVWSALRVGLGACANNVFVLTETWANAASDDRVRGRVLAFYTTGLSGGFALGPVALAVTGMDGVAPFVACSLVTLANGMLFTLLARETRTVLAPPSLRALGRFVLAAPLLLVMAMSFGFADWVGLSIMPLYFLESGLTPAAAALTVTVAHVGMILLQGPIGFALDRFSRIRVAAGCAALTAVSAAMLIGMPATGPGVWICVFALGGFSCGVYTSALAILGRRFAASMLVAGSALFSIAYTGAGSIGVATSGLAMGLLGPAAAPITLAVLFGGLFAVLAFPWPAAGSRRVRGIVPMERAHSAEEED